MVEKFYKIDIEGYTRIFTKVFGFTSSDLTLQNGVSAKRGEEVAFSYPLDSNGLEMQGTEISEKEFLDLLNITENAISSGDFSALVAKEQIKIKK